MRRFLWLRSMAVQTLGLRPMRGLLTRRDGRANMVAEWRSSVAMVEHAGRRVARMWQRRVWPGLSMRLREYSAW